MELKSEQSNKAELKVNRNIHTSYLICISKICKIDIETLYLLYEEFGENLFLVFYMLSGKQIRFPNITKLEKLMRLSRKIANNKIEEDFNVVSTTAEEKRILEYLKEVFKDKKNNKFIFSLEEEA